MKICEKTTNSHQGNRIIFMIDGHFFFAVIRLFKLKHYLKNILIFFPVFFSGKLLEYSFGFLLQCFLIFSLLSSAVYIFNDLCDMEKDRRHPQKCKRPLAAGDISRSAGVVIFLLTSVIACCWGYFFFNSAKLPLTVMGLYLILNIGYSLKWKNIPVCDLAILASGFLLRLLYGGCSCNITVSSWLYLTVLAVSFYMGIGKRLNEKLNPQGDSTRTVLSLYSKNYLENQMSLAATLGIVFYSQWSALGSQKETLLWTVPFVILAFFRYSYVVENKNNEDPVQIILKDRMLLVLGAITGLIIFISIYGDKISAFLPF